MILLMEMRVEVVNKKIGIISLVVILTLGIFGIVQFFVSEDKVTTLTAAEKQWIENNKNKLIDLSVLSNVPIINDNGNGILFDFLNDLEEDTKLEFNKLPYNKNLGNKETISDYALKNVEHKNDKDILLYRDNYALIVKKDIYFNSVSEIKDLTIGTLQNDLTKISKYLTGSSNVTFKPYLSADEMFTSLSNGLVDAIALPKIEYLENILTDKTLNIAYNITEYTSDYVLTLGDNERLNKILNKYFKKWNRETYKESLNKYLTTSYFKYRKIDEKAQAKFRSDRYTYGFVFNAPYDVTIKGGLKGFNYSFISEFAKAANIEIDYKSYPSIEKLLADFNANKLDFVFDYHGNDNYDMDVYNTATIYDSKIAVVANEKTDLVVNNVNSLTDYNVLTIKDSKIDKYLKDNGVKTKGYNNSKELVNHLGKKDVAAIDEYTYDYYLHLNMKELKKIQTIDLTNNYGFVSRDTSSNRVFNGLLSYYLSFVNSGLIMNNSYSKLLHYNNSNQALQIILSSAIIILLIIALVFTRKFVNRKKDYNSKLSKADKLRYIDTLTSLKNRNYLNDNIIKWDNSEVYPQSIIVIDLNNIAYINDNFGHVEGDKVIVEAAGILINNQLSGSEILRTNGNEFLIFMVGHDEKATLTYIRKLNKELKELSHGFGAAIGYSMIHDEIKTIDDAVNEATLDMRNNKEGINGD